MLARRLNQWVTAREMALCGYATSIMAAETRLSQRQCKRLCHLLAQEGYSIRQRLRLRSGLMLIRNRTKKMHASLSMLVYCQLGGAAIYQAIQRIAVQNAHRTYQAMQSRLPTHTWTAFDINDNWSMARELLNKEAFIRRCPVCGALHFTSIHQYTGIDCPFCVEETGVEGK